MIWRPMPYRVATESSENMYEKNDNNLRALSKKHFLGYEYVLDLSQPSRKYSKRQGM